MLWKDVFANALVCYCTARAYAYRLMEIYSIYLCRYALFIMRTTQLLQYSHKIYFIVSVVHDEAKTQHSLNMVIFLVYGDWTYLFAANECERSLLSQKLTTVTHCVLWQTACRCHVPNCIQTGSCTRAHVDTAPWNRPMYWSFSIGAFGRTDLFLYPKLWFAHFCGVWLHSTGHLTDCGQPVTSQLSPPQSSTCCETQRRRAEKVSVCSALGTLVASNWISVV